MVASMLNVKIRLMYTVMYRQLKKHFLPVPGHCSFFQINIMQKSGNEDGFLVRLVLMHVSSQFKHVLNRKIAQLLGLVISKPEELHFYVPDVCCIWCHVM